MIRSPLALRVVVAVMLLALSLGPFVNALTHGPGVIVAEAEHLAWHAERNGDGTEGNHHHHDASDHDHVTPAIMLGESSISIPAEDRIETQERNLGISVTSEALRRPPRPV
ncbi:hypothetical protein HOY34_07975 [Xinfangfangia sp. D13-10-4-6]|uniref:hypothetical protein n=1 Tax=Pseudogemmobacter hezensis TaxID=2737662 RepID=UPI001554628F|nr:hypothetical protein [Pseudogemmobacter hezensis]NPD15138.1 hypothetical protein [Pseudogemmobacter hezensis]